MKLNFAIPFCKVCFKEITNPNMASLLDEDSYICNDCFMDMEPQLNLFTVGSFRGESCYPYNEKIKEMLYLLKGCGDYELSKLFLVNQKDYFKLKYQSYYLVPSPSFHKRNESRGFNQVEAIFEGIGKGFIHAIEKIDDRKQSDLNSSERKKISEHLRWVKNADVKNKNILFVDDVITTGSTALACCNLLQANGAKKIRILSLARTKLKEIDDKTQKKKENYE